MASKSQSAFDGLETVEISNDDDGSWIDPETGLKVRGTITAFNPRGGRNDVVEIDGQPLRADRPDPGDRLGLRFR